MFVALNIDSLWSIVYWLGFAELMDFLLVRPAALGTVTCLLLLLDLERESLLACLLVSAYTLLVELRPVLDSFLATLTGLDCLVTTLDPRLPLLALL